MYFLAICDHHLLQLYIVGAMVTHWGFEKEANPPFVDSSYWKTRISHLCNFVVRELYFPVF